MLFLVLVVCFLFSFFSLSTVFLYVCRCLCYANNLRGVQDSSLIIQNLTPEREVFVTGGVFIGNMSVHLSIPGLMDTLVPAISHCWGVLNCLTVFGCLIIMN